METAEHNDTALVAVAEKLSVSFGPRQVLQDINLTLEKGRLYVLLGRSGVGKTTFLRSFNRLNECFPHCQTRGSLCLNLGSQWVDIYRDGLSVT